MLLTPEGHLADNMEPVMLLSQWSQRLAKEKQMSLMIFAGMGKPTFPMHDAIVKAIINYWQPFESKIQKVRSLIEDEKDITQDIQKVILTTNCVADYGDPQGELANRQQMAKALQRWYTNTPISAENILFTVGGAGALHNIFSAINRRYPHCRIVTPFPHYTLYRGPNGMNHLHPIHVMESPGYRLTAALVKESIEQAIKAGQDAISCGSVAKEGGLPRAFLLCDPSNPLGTVMTENEAKSVAAVLREYPDIWIILDEAYAEMCLNGQTHASLLRVAPDLRNRIILMRSATKALSAAGERMAITLAFDEIMMSALLKENTAIVKHAPKSLQIAFASAMSQLDKHELNNLVSYYGPQVDIIYNGLKQIGAAMPDPNYRIDGTFYVLADLSDLLGLPLPPCTKRALNKTGNIETDEDIIYYLLFTQNIMIAPLSYFGIDPTKGYVRITCSVGNEVLNTLLQRLSDCLAQARLEKQNIMKIQLAELLTTLKKINTDQYATVEKELGHLFMQQKNTLNDPLTLKVTNTALEKIIKDVRWFIAQGSPHQKEKAAIKIQSFFRTYRLRKISRAWKKAMDKQWRYLINKNFVSERIKTTLAPLPLSDRVEFDFWRKFLKENNSNDISATHINDIKVQESAVEEDLSTWSLSKL